jgi:hypothetical protein
MTPSVAGATGVPTEKPAAGADKVAGFSDAFAKAAGAASRSIARLGKKCLMQMIAPHS